MASRTACPRASSRADASSASSRAAAAREVGGGSALPLNDVLHQWLSRNHSVSGLSDRNSVAVFGVVAWSKRRANLIITRITDLPTYVRFGDLYCGNLPGTDLTDCATRLRLPRPAGKVNAAMRREALGKRGCEAESNRGSAFNSCLAMSSVETVDRVYLISKGGVPVQEKHRGRGLALNHVL